MADEVLFIISLLQLIEIDQIFYFNEKLILLCKYFYYY